MAGYLDRINVLIDVNTTKATEGLKNFRRSIAEADGVSGKLKAGWSSVTGGIKKNAGMLAAGAGAALVAFGVKAVGAFTDAAKAAIDFGKATGTTTEQASRWIAVADDFGMSASDLQAALGRVTKTIDTGKWAEYGIATRDASGKVRDANDIFLDALGKLGQVTDATERARIGNDLFGKGFAALSPLIGKTRAEYETMLGAVQRGQVITDDEADSAERMRIAQDNLNDALGEVTLAFGEAVAKGSPFLGVLTGVVQKAADLLGLAFGESSASDVKQFTTATADGADQLEAFNTLVGKGWENTGWLQEAAYGLEIVASTNANATAAAIDYSKTQELIGDLFRSNRPAAEALLRQLYYNQLAADNGSQVNADYANSLGLTKSRILDLADSWDVYIRGGNTFVDVLEAQDQKTNLVGDAYKYAAENAYKAEQANRQVAAQADAVADAHERAANMVNELKDAFGERKAWADQQLSLRDTAEKLEELNDQLKRGEITAEEYRLQVESTTSGAKADFAEYVTSLDELPDDVKTKVVLSYDPEDPQTTIDMIQAYMDLNHVKIVADLQTPAGMPWLSTGPKDEPYATSNPNLGTYNAAAAVTNIYVSGALDSVAVGAQIRKIINDDRARRGLPPI